MANQRLSPRRTSTRLSPKRSAYPAAPGRRFDRWPQITADQLRTVREPLFAVPNLGPRVPLDQMRAGIRRAATGPSERGWVLPEWLEPHQTEAARRVFASLRMFRGALLADAVGLGKTYVALALATRYDSPVAVVPASLKLQWVQAAERLAIDLAVLTHESLSRGATVPATSLIVVDEAHRFRNPHTRRYDQLARGVRHAHLLLITATPVVNRASDLVNLLRLAMPDNAFAALGLPSLERAAARRAYHELAFATGPAIVARPAHAIGTARATLPAVHDSGVHRPPTVAESTLLALVRRIAALDFPAFCPGQEAELLRLHLLARLASSAAACRETVRRHLVYTERAIAASRRGEALTRAAARALFSTEDELQLELGDWGPRFTPRDVGLARFQQERSTLARMLAILAAARGPSPKLKRLHRILHQRRHRKTIVFTTAVSTARALASGMRWREVAVVAAGRGWIASGPIPVDEALTLFAPKARGGAPPPTCARVNTLIATDVASEGLNLQDADALVHYDLPWTPVRLEQRVGRIARLRSPHRVTNVWWFAPHPVLERRLGLERRLAEKARCQLGLGATTTSRVGRARIINREFEQRETVLPAAADWHPFHRGYAVVQGPREAVFAIHWTRGAHTTPELVALAGNPPAAIRTYPALREILGRLLHAADSRADPPGALMSGLAALLRTRLTDAQRGPIHAAANRLARAVLRRGYRAGKRRDIRALEALDAALDRLHAGVAVGAERVIEDLLHTDGATPRLRTWLEQHAPASSDRLEWRIVAAIFGDGSVGESPDAVTGDVEPFQSAESASTSSSSK